MIESFPYRAAVLALGFTLLPGAATPAGAASREQDLLEIKNTILNLVDALVEQGVITAEKAQELKKAAAEKAKAQAEAEALAAAPVDEPPPEEAGQVIRVPYVPDFVKDEIRDEVRSELRGQVVEDVMRQAKTERWGVPEALPDWTRRFSFEGDIRLRAQGDFFAGDNATLGGRSVFVDFDEINDGTPIADADAAFNVSEDRERARLRLRLGVEAEVFNDLDARIRLATGSEGSAVSTNQTFDNDFGSFEVVLDRAYLKYTGRDADGYPWLTLWGGRMPNPYLSTDLVWDSDLNLDGGAATFRYNLAGGDDLFSMNQTDRSLFATLGLYAMDEVERDDNDKWLFGAQAGADLIFEDRSRLKLAASFYNFINVEGRVNELGSNLRDFSAPGNPQKGNSVFDISNLDLDGDGIVDPNQRFGLASDFDLVNLTAEYDITRFAPVHVILSADYVDNIGWDEDDIRARLEGRQLIVNNLDPTFQGGSPDDGETQGYLAKVTVGWPVTLARRSWQAFLGYKYLERDAVVDAFTDSDFHLGGTNAKGWILGGRYAIEDNTYITARYLTADEIDGPPLGIDVLQLDLVSEF